MRVLEGSNRVRNGMMGILILILVFNVPLHTVVFLHGHDLKVVLAVFGTVDLEIQRKIKFSSRPT